MLPDLNGPLADIALEIFKTSAQAAGLVHPVVFRELEELLRVVNSYYSNLIEGNATHPVDVMQAMRNAYSQDPAKRVLQQESVAHVEVQRLLEDRLREEPTLQVTDASFLCWLHEVFYQRIPDELRFLSHPTAGEKIEVVPGRLRESAVEVGLHISPRATELPRFLQRFDHVYRPDRLHGHQSLVALAAAHHRLLWIHPFLDGNGRVARLFTDAYLRRAGVTGYGLWTVSRGLARNASRYKAMLAAADSPRQSDLDGRGNLSAQQLENWCDWFLRSCLDQAAYITTLLRLEGLRSRIDAYTHLRKEGIAMGVQGVPDPLKPEARVILLHTLVAGEVQRGEFAALTGRSERSARSALSQLLAEGLVSSDTPKGPVRIGFPAHSIAYLFPDLVPVAPDP
ncbi:MAG: Fic family protein [Candidatus Thiodiazotropha sp.]